MLSGALTGRIGLAVSAVVTAVAVVVVVGTVDRALLGDAVARALSDPVSVAVAVSAFAIAFVMRAVAWRRVLPALGLGHALSAIHIALAANHVLPLRLGEPARVVSVVRRASVPVDAATASTVTLRSTDVLTMVAVGLAVAPSTFVGLVSPVGWVVLAVVAAVAVVSWRWLVRLAAGADPQTSIGGLDAGVLALSAAAWLAESVVVWQAARWAGLEIGVADAVLIATVAVGAQIAAIAPGGFGTYEAASVAAYAALGHDAEQALVAALAAHGLKTGYSLAAGVIAVLAPAPSLFGRLRLAPTRTREAPSADPAPVPAAPVLLFMPAHNEAASVGRCVARAPREVGGHPVQVLVIDDGSTDATVERAEAAGAEVISLHRNRGLGAAVRVGLAEAVSRQVAAVAFCDADGEYPPEELGALVGVILDGRADYVTGSRFLGRIDHMRPHRRVGNLLLTRMLSLMARTRITDGQTGYRAFSPAAAAEAEIIHDFNYAQVLTLDLLAKGFRMREVPISYHFRTRGESFVKLGRYLRNVVPAVYRELNPDAVPIVVKR